MRKNKKQWWKIVIMAAVVWAIGCVDTTQIKAEDYSPDRAGSIMVSLDDLGTKRSDVVLDYYKVADLTQEPEVSWVAAEKCQEAGVDWNGLKQTEDYVRAAERLQTYVEAQKIEGTAGKTDANGKVTFSNLEQGVYLIVQTDVASYGVISPFLVAVPYMEDGEHWIYDVTTQTKGEKVITPSPTSTPTVTKKPTPPSTSTRGSSVKSSVKTGDDTPVGGLLATAVVSVAVLAGVASIVVRRRKGGNR